MHFEVDFASTRGNLSERHWTGLANDPYEAGVAPEIERDERLVRLRRDLVEDICDGRIKGDQAISNIMILLKDARRSLAITESQTIEPRQQIFPFRKKAA